MADTRISGLATITGANLATGDLFATVDVSDTSMAGTGTDKSITALELRKFIGGTQANAVNGIYSEAAFLGLNFVATEYNNGKAAVDLRSSGGASIGLFAATPSGTNMAAIHVGGDFGTGLIDCAQIYCRATQTFSASQSGTAWDFYTTTNGTNVKSLALTLDNDGSATLRAGLTLVGKVNGATNLIDLSLTTSNTVNVVTATNNTTGFRGYAATATLQLELVLGNAGAGTPVTSASVIAAVNFAGATTTAANPTIYVGAVFRATATETWSGTLGGTKMEFRVTANGTHTRTTALTLDQDASATFAAGVTIAGALAGATTGAFSGNVTITAANLVTDTTTGMKIGTATNQKLALWNATPIIQPASANQAAVSSSPTAAGASYLQATAATWVICINDLKTLVNQLRSDLVASGNIKGAA